MKNYLLLPLLGLFLTSWTTVSRSADDRQTAVREVIDLYRLKIQAYCERYSAGEQMDIQEYLLTSQNVDFSSDVPGLESNQINASDYFGLLERKGVRVQYADTYEILVCGSSPPVFGVIIDKMITTSAGETYNYKDYIEVHLRGGDEARIFAIASSRYSDYQHIDCIKKRPDSRTATTPSPAKPACASFEEAERASAAGRRIAATRLYEDALKCGYREEYIRSRIEQLQAEETIASMMHRANEYYLAGDYSTAINHYGLLQGQRVQALLTGEEKELVSERLAAARNAIKVNGLMTSGDYHLDNRSYTKAYVAYRAAAALRPNDPAITAKLGVAKQYAEGVYRQQANREIKGAVALLNRHHRNNGAASVTLMKYADTGWLSGQELFYLIQLLDADSRQVKKAYGLTQREICVKTKLLLRQAAALGFDTQAFRIFRKDHLNNRSRTCR